MEREKGTLISWNNDKGYGFIRSHNGKKDIFLHLKSLPHYQRRPIIDDILTYEVGVDEKQQLYARYARIKGIAWSPFTIFWFGLTLIFGIYVYFVIRQTFPFHPLALYVAMSLLTIRAYSRDKSAAQSGKYRIPERRLHLFEILGGWPGALLAQVYYRHKSRKISYQILFWMIVASHCFLWYHILTHREMYRHYQQVITENVRSFVNQSTEQILYLSERINSQDALTDYDHAKMTEQVEKGRWPIIPSDRQLIKQDKADRRSIIIPDKQLRVVKGVVKEIRPREGVIVSLQLGTEAKGIIYKSTLADNFSTRFTPEELIQVAIHTIRMEGNRRLIELILVEK